MKTSKQENSNYDFVYKGYDISIRYLPEDNDLVPWVCFFYKTKEGEPIGTTGFCYSTKEDAIKSAKEFVNSQPEHGWLSPEGKFYHVAYSQHSVIVDLMYPHANGDYEVLWKQGWISFRHCDPQLDMLDFADKEVTRKQYDWIHDYCKKYNYPVPKGL